MLGLETIATLIFNKLKGPLSRSINNTIDNRFKEAHEKFKANLELQYKYNHRQFDIYSELWADLIEVDIFIDKLWDKKVWDDSIKLDETFILFREKSLILKKAVKIKSIFIDEKHYKGLLESIERIEEYQHGKEMLGMIKREYKSVKNNNIKNREEEDIISNNNWYRLNWKSLLKELEIDFKKKLSMK